MTQNERLDFLINHLISEDNRYSNIVIPKDSEEKFNLFRSLVNVREPKQISNEFIKLQDDYLQERLTEINIPTHMIYKQYRTNYTFGKVI